jgi:hypothetical protein
VCSEFYSQGCVADDAVVIADLVLKGKSHGPHAFVMPLRKNGALVKGVTITDMGDKTIANDLGSCYAHSCSSFLFGNVQ